MSEVSVQVQRRGVQAVPKPCRRRTVREQVAQVSAALRAQHLDPPHPQGEVCLSFDSIFVYGLPKAGPARARVVLGVRGEERGIAADAAIGALILGVRVDPGKGRLGALLLGDIALLRGQPGPVVPLFHRRSFCGIIGSCMDEGSGRLLGHWYELTIELPVPPSRDRYCHSLSPR